MLWLLSNELVSADVAYSVRIAQGMHGMEKVIVPTPIGSIWFQKAATKQPQKSLLPVSKPSLQFLTSATHTLGDTSQIAEKLQRIARNLFNSKRAEKVLNAKGV